MSYRSIDAASGISGGAICLATDPGRPRNIHVTILNNTASPHVAFFGRSRRELATPGPIGIAGLAIVAAPTTVVNQTVNGVAYSSAVLFGWVGELWCAADSPNTLQVDVFESGSVER